MTWRAISARTCRGGGGSGERGALFVGGALRECGELLLERSLLVCGGALEEGSWRTSTRAEIGRVHMTHLRGKCSYTCAVEEEGEKEKEEEE